MGRNSKILDLIAQRQKHKEENKTQPNHKRPTNSGASVSGVLIVKWFIFHQMDRFRTVMAGHYKT